MLNPKTIKGEKGEVVAEVVAVDDIGTTTPTTTIRTSSRDHVDPRTLTTFLFSNRPKLLYRKLKIQES